MGGTGENDLNLRVMLQFLFFTVGFGSGAVIVWLFVRVKASASGISKELFEAKHAELQQERAEKERLISELSGCEADLKNLREKSEEHKRELEEIQNKFTEKFENIAHKIFEEKTSKFTEQNKNNLDIILNPLKEKIRDFEKKVEDSYKAEAAERNTLKGEIKKLVEINKQISEEANNLAKALKGDTKKQGNWGEMILEKILERSGLTKGQEYMLQNSTLNDEGRRIQPDAVVHLPDNKHIIIDAKVSLVAYDAYVNCDGEEERVRHLKAHIESVRRHIKELSDKNYPGASLFNAPDFTIMFIPVEPCFSLVLQTDQELFGFAWDRKIVVVSPTTLLATLRTVASIWKQEKQNRNALEIARQSGELYDKFVGFSQDLIDLGTKLQAASKSYEGAMNKLVDGRGNLVKRAEEIKKLGAKANKEQDVRLVQRAQEEVALVPENTP